MQLFNDQKFEKLDDLLIEQIEDLYDAEKRLCNVLPKMADAASDAQLAEAFRAHHRDTERHVDRLEQVFKLLGKEPSRETCDAMKGLIKEGESMMEAKGSPGVRDAALIAAAQRIEHYEIAGYGSARSFATQLGLSGVATVLQQTLDEEGAADHRLTDIAVRSVNPKASHAVAS